jgi:hypothetical protein
MSDVAFIGRICFGEAIPYRGSPRVSPGSAVLRGALAAALRPGFKPNPEGLS